MSSDARQEFERRENLITQRMLALDEISNPFNGRNIVEVGNTWVAVMWNGRGAWHVFREGTAPEVCFNLPRWTS